MTVAFYRIIMKVIRDSITLHIDAAIHTHQCGARKERACSQASTLLPDHISSILDDKPAAYVLFLDIAIAFSSLALAVLTNFLEVLCVPPGMVQLIRMPIGSSEFFIKDRPLK